MNTKHYILIPLIFTLSTWSIASASVSVAAAPAAVSMSNPGINPQKRIDIDLSDETLSYYFGNDLVNTIKISAGLPRTPTPTGTFAVEAKIPVKEFYGHNMDGSVYDFKNTLWNLKFLPTGYYIHGAYWHNNFGHPMSHGCINVSYADMPQLYTFADVGTTITIHQ